MQSIIKVLHLKHIFFTFIFDTGSYFHFWAHIIFIAAWTIFVLFFIK